MLFRSLGEEHYKVKGPKLKHYSSLVNMHEFLKSQWDFVRVNSNLPHDGFPPSCVQIQVLQDTF